MKKKGFTLLELIIVMIILSMLFVLLLRTYNWIATMVFRVQQEKEVSQEILQISQIMQNFSDRNTIDYEKYFALSSMGLVDTQGITDTLYLTGQDGAISFFSSGTLCNASVDDYAFSAGTSICSFYMINSDGNTIELINPKKIAISSIVFKVIPFASEDRYLATDSLCAEGNYLHCLNEPGFWMIFKAYSSNYGQQRATNVSIPFQQFF